MQVDEAIRSRISTRQFKPDPVPESALRDILDVARYAPSGGNIQPWRVIVVTGAARDAATALARQAQAENAPSEEAPYTIYPENLWEPLKSRRYQVGMALYEQMGIAREDKAARNAHMARNAEFFGAPVGMFFITDTRCGHGQWADVGMFMQSVGLAAEARGLATCFQLYWGLFRKRLHRHFGLGETEVLVSGLALGYADPEAPANKFRSIRAPVDDIATFLK